MMNKENDFRKEYNKYKWIPKDINKSKGTLSQLKNAEEEIYQLTSMRFLISLYNQNMQVKKEI